MPSLDDILKDTLIKVGAVSNPGGLKEFEPGADTVANRPSPNPVLGPAAQPVWVWDYTGVREIRQEMPMNRVENLEAWSRTVADMHGVDLGWMTVAQPIEWGPVIVTLPTERVVLPLIQKYFVKGLMLSSGNNPGTSAWWPLPADLDQSFASVFCYDLTSRQQNQPPGTVDAAHFNRADFMPDPNVDVGDLPIGATADTDDRHFICIVLSLVCMQERADFEPGGIIGMGRFYPHFMIMSNKRIPHTLTIAGTQFDCGIEATVRVTRPNPSGYHGSFANPGGAPRIMQHPDMDVTILPLLITEPNLPPGLDPMKLLSIPYWDLMFDYFLPIDYRNGATGPLPRNTSCRVVDRSLTAVRRVKGVLQHLDYTKLLNVVGIALANPAIIPQLPPAVRLLGLAASKLALSRPSLQAVMFGNFFSLLQIGKVSASDFLPHVKADLIKQPRQGTFDNLHLAPRMKAHQVIGTPQMTDPKWQSSLDTLDTLRMAPFCEHDCMHTHWRWGLAFKLAPNQLPIQGFDADADAKFAGTGKPYRVLGNTMVPLNQDVDIAFGGNQQLIYTARIVDSAPGVWQPVYHHGSAYVLGYSTAGGVLHDVSKTAIGNSQEELRTLLEHALPGHRGRRTRTHPTQLLRPASRHDGAQHSACAHQGAGRATAGAHRDHAGQCEGAARSPPHRPGGSLARNLHRHRRSDRAVQHAGGGRRSAYGRPEGTLRFPRRRRGGRPGDLFRAHPCARESRLRGAST